jgi:hypothetical protein
MPSPRQVAEAYRSEPEAAVAMPPDPKGCCPIPTLPLHSSSNICACVAAAAALAAACWHNPVQSCRATTLASVSVAASGLEPLQLTSFPTSWMPPAAQTRSGVRRNHAYNICWLLRLGLTPQSYISRLFLLFAWLHKYLEPRHVLAAAPELNPLDSQSGWETG